MEPQYESNRNHDGPSFHDLLKLKVQIHHFDHLSHIQCETFNPPTIVFKKLFSQEGQDYIRTHLSTVSFLTSNMLNHIISHIIYEVQQLYNIDIIEEEDNLTQPNVFNLNLEIEIHEDDIEEEIGMIPASKDAIERIKTTCDLNVTKLRDILCCTICMDEFEFDDINETSNICTMPCSHVFHEQCIVKWLQTSNTCPLCRYSMP
ncbi:NEP1-interacting protein-like 2 [Lathyrus oleraceus]|uniref:NEP1-interacting protein-like 2 n=1 Tax=Pisum sativum TaxID=3888 RepID=UPI0021D1A73F|nr:NEP1-interacting protein-like 2 [Pisum sativum]